MVPLRNDAVAPATPAVRTIAARPARRGREQEVRPLVDDDSTTERDQVEGICDAVVVIHKGRVVAQSSVAGLGSGAPTWGGPVTESPGGVPPGSDATSGPAARAAL